MTEQSSGQVYKDAEGRVVSISHIEEPFVIQKRVPAAAAAAAERPLNPAQTAGFYVREVADLYGIAKSVLRKASESPPEAYVKGEGSLLHIREVKRSRDAHVVSYVQTYRGLTVWQAGLVVRMAGPENVVIGSSQSLHDDLEFRVGYWTDFEEAEFRAGKAAVEARLKALLDQTGLSFSAVHSQKELVYRYREADRKPREDPSLALPDLASEPVPAEIEDGKHYVVTECRFATGGGRVGPLNWVIFFEVFSGAVLYVRPLVSSVEGLVFSNDPLALSGDATLTPTSPANELNAYRRSVSLERLFLPAPPADVVLRGRFVEIQEIAGPVAAPPAEPNGTGAVFNYTCTSDGFAAVNAYWHLDELYKLVESLGLDLETYFDGTVFPIPVDPRGEAGVNAHHYGNAAGDGTDHYTFGVAGVGSTVGIAADAPVVCHEFGHAVLQDNLHDGNLGFCEGIGDVLAAVLYDPESHAPDRGLTFPFVGDRRHDRTVAAGWGFGGPCDTGGYDSEEILATVAFRAYQSIGGDDRSLSERQYASRYICYLLLQAPALISAGIPNTTVGFSTAMQEADATTRFFDGYSGATVRKVVRWAFERQNLYGGNPPDVDVYFDDGRAGAYEYPSEVLKSNDIWNRHCADGGLVNQTPKAGTPNFLYVRVRNRGTQPANNVTVEGYQPSGNNGLVWPDDWQPLTTPSLVIGGSIPAGGNTIIGPFEWTPQKECENQVLMSCAATDDDSNIHSVYGEVLTRRLTTFDNNIAIGNIEPPRLCTCVKAPTVDVVVSPTPAATVTLTGGKQPGTAIHIKGVEVVAVNNSELWSATVNLDLGGNLIPIIAVRANGESSDPAYAFVDRQMYVRLAGDTMTGALQLDNADTTGGLRMRADDSGPVEWNIKADEDDIRIEHNPTSSTLTIGKK